MYLWKTESLAKEIKENLLSTNDWKKYYLFGSLFVMGVMYLNMFSPKRSITAVLVEVIYMIGIFIYGINKTYKTNKGDAGVDYISRMTALTIPISIKLMVLALGYGIVSGIVNETLAIPAAFNEWEMVILTCFIQTLSFWRINVHLKFINN
jgi:hypothetical protein